MYLIQFYTQDKYSLLTYSAKCDYAITLKLNRKRGTSRASGHNCKINNLFKKSELYGTSYKDS